MKVRTPDGARRLMRRMLHSSLLAACTGVAAWAVGCAGRSTPPNVVVIVVDSLRADALGCYGDKPASSPRIDEFAAEGLRFERAMAQASWNLPSVSSLVTSAPPWATGWSAGAPAEDTRTLAEVFSRAGHRTGAFTEVAWPLLQRGFETFVNAAGPDMYGDPAGNSATKTFGAALGWVRREDKRPFFLLVHTYEVHSYFLGKPAHRAFAKRELPAYQGRFLEWQVRDQPAGPRVFDALLGASPEELAFVRSLYRGAVAEVDAEVGRFVAGLKEAGLDERTVLVLTSSNGEGFRPDLKRVHHGGRLHDDVLRVPLIVRWPGHIAPAASRLPVESLDLGPTLLALAGLGAEPAFVGRALVAAESGLLSRFRGPRFALSSPAEKPLVAEESTFRILPSGQRETGTARQLALYSEGVTLLEMGDRAELYDLKADPQQERDLSGQHAATATALREQLRRLAASSGAQVGTDDATVEQLRSLGYVQ
jgi:arylsulfatase A-like enzyme